MICSFVRRLVFGATILSTLMCSVNVRAGFINGDFETGDLTGWSTQLFFSGSMGGPGFPRVELFETKQGEISQAVVFNVGKLNSALFGFSSGGGIYQNLFLPAGPYRVMVDVAAANNTSYINEDAGQFYVELDDLGSYPNSLGRIYPNTIIRDHLSVDINVPISGIHKIWILVVRDGGNVGDTPRQYIDNLQITSLIPEPSFMGLSMGCSVAGLFSVRGRRHRRGKNEV